MQQSLSHLETELHQIYNHVNDMLKFAEAKNAGLIAFNIALIIGVTQSNLLSSERILINYAGWYIITFNVLSVFFALISVVAKLRNHEKKPITEPSDNLLYFGTLALLTPQELLDKMKTKYGFRTQNADYEFDMARQIVIVSQITLRKYRLFNIAIGFTFASIPPLPLFYFIYDFWHNPNR